MHFLFQPWCLEVSSGGGESDAETDASLKNENGSGARCKLTHFKKTQ